MDMNDEDGELDIFHQSPYFDDDDLINHIKNKQDKFIVLSLNCQSLNAKIDEIIIKLDILRKTVVKLVLFVYKKRGFRMILTRLCYK